MCNNLFDKLCNTAAFLEKVLESLGDTDEGQKLLEKIMELKLDLDKSMHETKYVAHDLKSIIYIFNCILKFVFLFLLIKIFLKIANFYLNVL